jgi:ribonuclease P protein component
MEPQSFEKDKRPARAHPAFGRLKRRAEFQRVSRGRKKPSFAFTLQAAGRDPAAGAAAPRFGLTVTRKIGGAVVRNRVRRRLKEAVRAALPLEARQDCDYVLLARREALSRDFVALVADLRKAFEAISAGQKDFRRPTGQPAAKGEIRRT